MLKRTFFLISFIILSGVFTISFGQEGESNNSNTVAELDGAEKFIQLCKSRLEAGEADEAVNAGKKAVQIDNNNSQCHFWLGHAYGMKAQEASILKKFSYAKKCKAEWEKAVELDGRNVDARIMLMNYHLQAPGIAGGNKSEAKKQASEISKIDPLRGHLALAQIYESEKEFDNAEQEYKKTLKLGSTKIENYFYLGYFYQRQKRYEKARELFLKILEIDPNELDTYYQLGRTAVLSGVDLENGITYFERYLENEPKPNSPSWASAHWRMGMIYEKLGDKVQAGSEYKKALELDPEHKQAKKALKKLKR